VQSIIADANSADKVTLHALLQFSQGVAHLKKVFQCAYTGGFIGEYTGANPGYDHGRFGATVKPDGSIEAVGNTLATPAGVGFDSLDLAAVHIDQARSFTINDPNPPFPLSGNFSSPDAMQGLWQNNGAQPQNGGFSGTRLGPSLDLIAGTTRHFAGDIELTADPMETIKGILAMDVDQSGAVSGFVYRFIDGNLLTIVGTLDAGTNMFTGTFGDTAAKATLAPADATHPDADFLDGSYTPTGQASVSFYTDGCSLE